MMAAIASIPARYFKYNAALAQKMDIALTEVDRLQRLLRGEELNRQDVGPADGQTAHQTDRRRMPVKQVISKQRTLSTMEERRGRSLSIMRSLSPPPPMLGKGDYYPHRQSRNRSVSPRPTAGFRPSPASEPRPLSPTRRRVVQKMILTLLHSVWRTAWQPYSPKTRHFHVTDVETPHNLVRAEQALNRLAAFRRIAASSNGRGAGVDADADEILQWRQKWGVEGGGQGYVGRRRAWRDAGPSNQGRVLGFGSAKPPGSAVTEYLWEPTHVFRRSAGYTPPHVYLYGRFRDMGAARRAEAQAAMTKATRAQFVDAMVKARAWRDADIERILWDVIEERRLAALEADEDDADMAGCWRAVRDQLRREFWLSRSLDEDRKQKGKARCSGPEAKCSDSRWSTRGKQNAREQHGRGRTRSLSNRRRSPSLASSVSTSS
ncbi:hypothetical protein DFJ73DRAFT_556423 [Zopfochytrium polystomum]|nr:hypothetical protein DFJ73DRAFT_556423 [Zopfochytrium polystomum]